MDATYTPGMDAVYQTTGHSVSGPEQFSLQPSASQGKEFFKDMFFFLYTYDNPRSSSWWFCSSSL